MKGIKIFSLNFDTKTKIVMSICIVIAICIITYSFYTICIKQGKTENIGEKTLEYYLNAQEYETEFNITVNSNKNSNTYYIYEKANLSENTYEFVIDEKLRINVSSNEIKLSKENIDYEYITSVENEYLSNNFISFSSIIKTIEKIKDNTINGTIKRIEVNENVIYKISLQQEYIKKVGRIELTMSKNEENIQEIRMYDFNDNEMYVICISNFIVKK